MRQWEQKDPSLSGRFRGPNEDLDNKGAGQSGDKPAVVFLGSHWEKNSLESHM